MKQKILIYMENLLPANGISKPRVTERIWVSCCIGFLTLFILCSCKKELETPKETEQPTTVQTSLTRIIKTPVKGNTHLPRLRAQYGKLHMTWVEQEGDLAILNYAVYDNDTWSTTRTISSGKDWFVNGADFPALAINGETVLTNLLQKSAEGTYDYDIKLNLLAGDKVLKSDFLLHTDGIPAEHGFVAMAPYDDGFYVSWLDGRNTKNENKENNAMALFSARVGLDGTITESTMIDNRVCDCCNTAIAITHQGPVVVYRDRSQDEEEVRDIAIVRWVDGAWTAPKTLYDDSWKINGCPVNGPAIDALGENLVVSWFTASDDDPKVNVIFSKDNGATFEEPLRVDTGQAIGRVDTTFLEDGSALVLWMEPQQENTVIQLRRVYPDGRMDEAITIAKTDGARSNGFPQLEVIQDTAYITSTELDGDQSAIKLIALEISSDK